MSLPYQILACLVALVLAFGAGWAKRGQLDDLKAQAAIKASLEQSREIERKRQEIFDQNARHLVNELNANIARRDRVIERLRNDRRNLPANPGVECPRTDWRTLDAEMGAEIVRDIAKADEYREGLISCYAALDSLR
jgi:hypothetical protein